MKILGRILFVWPFVVVVGGAAYGFFKNTDTADKIIIVGCIAAVVSIVSGLNILIRTE